MSAEQLLGSLPDDDAIIVADLEAGIGTLTRLEEGSIDLTMIVVEPTPRSLDVGSRALAVASERRQGRSVVIANKIRSPDDVDLVRSTLGVDPIVVVPDDMAVVEADRQGTSFVDDPDPGPAMKALEGLATKVV